MKTNFKFFLLFVLLAALVMCAEGTISVGTVSIDPSSGDLVSGQTPVSASFTIKCIPANGVTFPSDDTIKLQTEMAQPKWSIVIVKDGIANPAKEEIGSIVHISGWELSYPARTSIELQIKLNAVAPQVTEAGNKVVFSVQEVGGDDSGSSGEPVTKEAYVVSAAAMDKSIADLKVNLTKFQDAIDQKMSQGFDVTEAKKSFNLAKTAIDNADKSDSFSVKKTGVTTALKYISDGQASLSKAGSLKDLTAAQNSIDSLDALIATLKQNKNLANDERLASIIATREAAAQALTAAKDANQQGNGSESANQLKIASSKAGDGITAANALKNQQSQGGPVLPSVPADTGRIIGLIVMVIIIIGVVICVVVVIALAYNKFRRGGGRRGRYYDELG